MSLWCATVLSPDQVCVEDADMLIEWSLSATGYGGVSGVSLVFSMEHSLLIGFSQSSLTTRFKDGR
jgi:hypothetical protein